MPWSTWKPFVLVGKKKKCHVFFSPTVNAWLLLTSWKACDWSRHIFGASASPRSLPKKSTMSPSCNAHGGQHDTKYQVRDIQVAIACGIRGWRNFGFVLEAARTLPLPGIRHVCLYMSKHTYCCWLLYELGQPSNWQRGRLAVPRLMQCTCEYLDAIFWHHVLIMHKTTKKWDGKKKEQKKKQKRWGWMRL